MNISSISLVDSLSVFLKIKNIPIHSYLLSAHDNFLCDWNGFIRFTIFFSFASRKYLFYFLISITDNYKGIIDWVYLILIIRMLFLECHHY